MFHLVLQQKMKLWYKKTRILISDIWHVSLSTCSTTPSEFNSKHKIYSHELIDFDICFIMKPEGFPKDLL